MPLDLRSRITDPGGISETCSLPSTLSMQLYLLSVPLTVTRTKAAIFDSSYLGFTYEQRYRTSICTSLTAAFDSLMCCSVGPSKKLWTPDENRGEWKHDMWELLQKEEAGERPPGSGWSRGRHPGAFAVSGLLGCFRCFCLLLPVVWCLLFVCYLLVDCFLIVVA